MLVARRFRTERQTACREFQRRDNERTKCRTRIFKGKSRGHHIVVNKMSDLRQRNSKLNQIAKSYQGKDVVFLGLTTDNPTRVESFLKMKPFNFEIMPSSFGVLLKYADRERSGNIAMGYPAYFLVNQDGRNRDERQRLGQNRKTRYADQPAFNDQSIEKE